MPQSVAHVATSQFVNRMLLSAATRETGLTGGLERGRDGIRH